MRSVEPPPREDGFTLIELAISLTLIFALLLGLLATLATGVRAVLSGRQRQSATAYANELIEQARALPFGSVGVDQADFAEIGTFPGVTSCGMSDLCFEGATIIRVPGTSLTAPFTDFHTQSTRDGTVLDRYLLVVEESGGSTSRRVIAIVRVGNPATGGVADEVRVETLVGDFTEPAQPRLTSEVQVATASVSVAGSWEEPSAGTVIVQDASLSPGSSYSFVDWNLISIAQGYTETPPALITDGSAATTSAQGVRLDALSDTDAGTVAAALHLPPGITDTLPATLSGSGLTITRINGTTTAFGQAAGTAAAPTPEIDSLPWEQAALAGPTSQAMDFNPSGGIPAGHLAEFIATGGVDATSSSDGDWIAADQGFVTSQASLVIPQARLFGSNGGGSPWVNGVIYSTPAGGTPLNLRLRAGHTTLTPQFGTDIAGGAGFGLQFWNGASYTAEPLDADTGAPVCFSATACTNGQLPIDLDSAAFAGRSVHYVLSGADLGGGWTAYLDLVVTVNRVTATYEWLVPGVRLAEATIEVAPVASVTGAVSISNDAGATFQAVLDTAISFGSAHLHADYREPAA